MIMKDFLKQEIKLNDRVILTAPSYRHLVLAKVIAFTPTKVRVEYNNTWNYPKEGKKSEYLSEPNFLVVVKGNDYES